MEDVIGSRMKHNYEQVSDTRLIRRMPVAIRIDGCHFHTFTRHFKKPFDRLLMGTMQETMKYLCENIQGCILGYTQSDEITLILIDYKELDSDAWYDNRLQKISSVSASMATLAFNRIFHEKASHLISLTRNTASTPEEHEYAEAIRKADEAGATFDSRCFNIPKEEVCNLIYWRQADASRNSIQMAGHAYFSQEEMDGKGTSDIQDMLHEGRGINWNDYPTDCKRGSCCVKNDKDKWYIDDDIPIFKGQGRDYIDRLVYVGED